MSRRLLSQEDVRQALSNSPPVPINGPDVVISNIVELVCYEFQVEPAEIYGRCQERWLSKARHVAMTLAHTETSLSMNEIAVRFERDRGTVQAAIKHILSDKTLRGFASTIREKLHDKENLNDSDS